MSTKRKTKIKQNENISETNVDTISPPTETDDNTSLWHDPFIHVLLILATGFAVYFNSISTPFILDDHNNIIHNPAIKNFRCFPDTNQVFNLALNGEIQDNFFLRPVCYFTFAVNYAIHGLDQFGYHIVNLLLHISNAMMLYLLFTRIQDTPAMTAESANSSSVIKYQWYLPLFAAIFFICHPIQTQSVVYIIQRFVPLATFFYLAALIMYDISRKSAKRRIRYLTYFAALAATVLGMESKEIAFTIPAVILLYEFIFYSGKISTRLARIVPFILTMAIIPMKLSKLTTIAKPQGMEASQTVLSLRNIGGASPIEYLMTQFGVIATYIRLLFLPVNQNLDYDYPLQTSFFSIQVILPLLLLLAIAGFGIFCLLRSKNNNSNRLIAFGIFWFFITISVESSIVPIKDLIFEHRIYLPSIGFFLALAVGINLLYRRFTNNDMAESRKATVALVIAALILSITSIYRVNIWENDVTLWSDVIIKSPNKARAHNNLGAAIFTSITSETNEKTDLTREQEEKLKKTIYEFSEAIRLDPSLISPYANIVKALTLQKSYDEAKKYAETVLKVVPNDPDTLTAKGVIFQAMGDLDEAERIYRENIRLNPLYARVRWQLADVLVLKGAVQEALQELDALLKIYPDETVTKKIEVVKMQAKVSQPATGTTAPKNLEQLPQIPKP